MTDVSAMIKAQRTVYLRPRFRVKEQEPYVAMGVLLADRLSLCEYLDRQGGITPTAAHVSTIIEYDL